MMWILGHTYTLILNDDVENRECYGSSEQEPNKITIYGKDENMKLSSLVHELVHVIDFHLGIGLSEQQVKQLETGLFQALNENGVDLAVLWRRIDEPERDE